MIMSFKWTRKIMAPILSAAVVVSAFASIPVTAPIKVYAAQSEHEARFLTMYNQLKDPLNGYFSKEGIPYHAVETLMSEAPDYGHMTTSEAYSYWLWLETLYGYYTGDWKKLEQAWDNMEKYIIPVNGGQPTMNYYNPASPASYAAEHPQPDMYPSGISGKYSAGRDPLDAELKAAYGNNQTYLMHWLMDVDNWYGYGNLLYPSHTATYVNTFQRGAQESVWEAVPHPSQDNHSFGKPGEGFMSLFTKESSAPAKQWRYTNATDADARAVQVMYWAKEMGYNNNVYLDKAKKMGDYLRYGMYDKYFMKIGSGSSGNPTPGNGKDSSHYLMSWYTAWGGGLEQQTGNWAWRIGASHAHHAYQNVVAAYALSQPQGGLIPKSATAQQDWDMSLKRQLEFYTWLQSSEGAIGGGATNSWNGDYSAYPSGKSTFYGMAYDEAPVYVDPPSNSWFGFQTWPLERVAELYYIMALKGETNNDNFRMAKQVIQNWVDWSIDYVFVNEQPVTDDSGYYLNANGSRIMGGKNPAVATVPAPGQFYVPGSQEWIGQPDTWAGFNQFSGNPNFRTVTKDPSQDVGVLGSYIKALTFYAAGTQAETGRLNALGNLAKTKAEALLDVAWGHNDGKGITTPEARGDYYRFFTKEVYFPAGWSGKFGQGNTIPGAGGVPSDPSKGGNGVYISYAELRPEIKKDPQWSYLENLYKTSYNPVTKKWEKGTPTFEYHRFWSQVDMATAYAEFDRLLGDGGSTPVQIPGVPSGLAATAGDKQVTLSWAPSTGAVSYNIKRSSANGGPYTVVASNVSGTSHVDVGLINDTSYYYVVTAVNAAGESSNSAQVVAIPKAQAPQVPAAPSGLTATAGNAKVDLSWAAVQGATGYHVKAATTNGGPYTVVASNVTGTVFSHTGLTNDTTYYYVVSAVNTAGEGLNSAQASATPKAPVIPTPTSGLVVQYRAGDTNATDNQIKPQFNIKNTGTTAVDLSTITLRYYFSKDGSQDMNSWIDWAQIGGQHIQRTFTDTYVELSFTPAAGSIAAGSQTGDIQLRMSKNDWSNFNEANDYSFDPTKTSYADWNKVTLYQNGVLVWGIEP